MKKIFFTIIRLPLIAIIILSCFSPPIWAANGVRLDIDLAVDMAMNNSYKIKQVELGIERTRFWLKATQAGLKTKLTMNLKVPVIEAVTEYKWNSFLQRDELVFSDTQLLQMDFSVRQPIILFGFPTNGYLSLNNKIYQYKQNNGSQNITYYNRYFIKFEQPFFQPNHLKNAIDGAKLDLEENELRYLADIVGIIESTSDDFYDVFRYSYRHKINTNRLNNLRNAEKIVDKITKQDQTRSFEKDLIQVELVNMQEKMYQNLSDLKLKALRFKRRLGLNGNDSLMVPIKINVLPIEVGLEKALDFGFKLHPKLKLLKNRRQQNEINLSNTEGLNSFRVDLEMTYGIEKQDESYASLWQENENSYSVSVNAHIPLWDWGQRKARIEASKISIKRTDLYIEEVEDNILSEIKNAVINLEEYQKRAMKTNQNVEMAKEITRNNIELYKDNFISLQDLFQTIIRQADAEKNFLRAYLGYRRSLLDLMFLTHYDFEDEINIFDKYASNKWRIK